MVAYHEPAYYEHYLWSQFMNLIGFFLKLSSFNKKSLCYEHIFGFPECS